MRWYEVCYNTVERSGGVKILYKQPECYELGSLSRFGVQHCYFKKLYIDRDSITKKIHHHTGFELHIITEGSQEYEIGGTVYTLNKGSFLIVYPNVKHTIIRSTPHTQKYSVTFFKNAKDGGTCFLGKTPQRMLDDILCITNEASLNKEISDIVIENNVLEIILLAFRLSGIKENENTQVQSENEIIALAKQYIDDNIEANPSVEDVSRYCHLSTKQLTRIFYKFEDVSPKEYIIGRRVAKIDELLADHALSLKQISETMSFSSEYYFNAFVKKYAGMPPGEYRKMLGK